MPGAADEGQTLRVFVRARPLAHKHQLRIRIAIREDDLVAALRQRAALALAEKIADRGKRSSTLLSRQNGTERDEWRHWLIAD